MGYSYTFAQVEQTIDYYVARSTDGSSLSRVVNAGVLAMIGRPDAWDHWQRALRIDEFAVVAPAFRPHHVIGEVRRDDRRGTNQQHREHAPAPADDTSLACRRAGLLDGRHRMNRQAQWLVFWH